MVVVVVVVVVVVAKVVVVKVVKVATGARIHAYMLAFYFGSLYERVGVLRVGRKKKKGVGEEDEGGHCYDES